MDLIMLMILMLIIAVPFGVLMLVLIKKASYKNRTTIARQTGKDINDVVWIDDNFRVKNIDGVWEIQFRRMKEKTQSIDGKFFTKFLKKKYQNKILQYPKELWDTLDMRQHINRGIFFYETTEGELFPMTIIKQDDGFAFSLVNQDNRQFVMRETQNINALTNSKKNEIKLLAGIVIGILVLGVVFVVGGYWENGQHEKNIAATQSIGMEYAKTVYNMTCGNGPAQYINSLKIPQGTPGG